MVLFKTDFKHMFGVRKYAKHATEAMPLGLTRGDTILIQVTFLSNRLKAPTIEYAMTFVDMYRDDDNESDRIWQRHWTYIVRGEAFHPIAKPFDIRRVQRSKKNYAAAVKYAYLEREDEEAIREGGYLDRGRSG